MERDAFDVAVRHARRFLDGVSDRTAAARATTGEVAAALGGSLPRAGVAPATVIEQLVAAAEPGLVATAGPRFFGWVMGGSVEAATAADLLTVAWDQVASLQEMSPAGAAAEEVAGGWLLDLLGLPAEASFGLTTGAQMANFTALAAARHAVLARAGWDVERDGLQGAPRIRVIVGAETHPTVLVALRYLGFGAPAAVAEADTQGRILPASLGALLASERAPTIVCAQAGNVNSGSFDPFDAVADLCAEHGAWLHIDGAFGLWAAASPHLRHLTRGVDRADSWATDCHKWLNVPYDSALVACRDAVAHATAMSWSSAYVVLGSGREPSMLVPEASRRARGFAVWAALRQLGADGVAAMIERSCAHAGLFAALVGSVPGVEVLNDVVLNQVVLRFADSDEVTRRTIAAVQAEGTCWLGGTHWQGREAMRFSTTNWATTAADIERSAAVVVDAFEGARQARP